LARPSRRDKVTPPRFRSPDQAEESGDPVIDTRQKDQVTRDRWHAARSLLLGMALPAVLALGGCGENSEEQVRSTALLAFTNNPDVCDRLSDKFLEQLHHGDAKACRRALAEQPTEPLAEVRKVTVDGERGSVIAESKEGVLTKLEFIEEGGDWKVDGIGEVDPSEQGSNIEEQKKQLPKPLIRTGLTPLETVDSYLNSIDEEDGPALCGLLSKPYAREIAGDYYHRHAYRDCVAALEDYKWSDAHEQADGVQTLKVRVSRDRATVVLSSGKRALLRKIDGRWVISDIRK
jgi:hypothetical protein